MLRIDKWFLFLLFIAFLLRILVLSWSLTYRLNSDVLRYREWVQDALTFGITDSYTTLHVKSSPFANNQPPGTVYVLIPFYQAGINTTALLHVWYPNIFKQHSPVAETIQTIFLRLPSILSDVCLGIIIFWYVSYQKNMKAGYLASALFLFNPSLIYNSTFWGQMDSVIAIFFILSLFFLFHHKYFLSLLCYFLCLYIKLSYLPLLPFILLLLFLKMQKKMYLLLILSINSAFVFFITLPVSKNPIAWLYHFFITSSQGENKSMTNFACNLWWFLLKPLIYSGNSTKMYPSSQVIMKYVPSPHLLLQGVSLEIWAYTLFGILLIPCALMISKKSVMNSDERLLLVVSIILFNSFLFLPRMHERYLYPVFPLLAILSSTHRRYLLFYLVLSLLHGINLYLVWHPMHTLLLPFILLSNRLFQWCLSAAILGTGIFFTVAGYSNISMKQHTHFD